MRRINWDGRIFTSGRWPRAPVNIILIKQIAVIGLRTGEYGRRDPEKGRANTEAIYQLASNGEIDPYVCRGFPLEPVEDAMRLLANREEPLMRELSRTAKGGIWSFSDHMRYRNAV